MNSIILRKIWSSVISFVVVFCVIATVLCVSQKGYVAYNNGTDNNLIDEDTWYQVKNTSVGSTAESANHCLLIYDKNDLDSVNIMENMEYTLSVLNVDVDTMSVKVYEELDDTQDDDALTYVIGISTPTLYIDYIKYQDIVICTPSFSSIGIDINQLTTWCSNGGHIMFAGGIDDTIDLSTWGELLGINVQEGAPLVLADSLQFNTNLLVGADGMEFSDDVISCEVMGFTLNSDCTLHISTSDELETPILWERNCDNGMVIVCNAILMDAKNDRGIIVAAYCRFYPIYVYPVINASTYCIDDCPSPAPAGYDSNIVSQYGYTVRDFLSNVWLPSMESIVEKYGIKFSSFTIETYENDVEPPFDNVNNETSAEYYASRILYLGGEVGIHGYNHQPLVLEGYQLDKENQGYTPWNSVQSMIDSIRAVVSYTEGLVDDLEVTAYVAPSNVISN